MDRKLSAILAADVVGYSAQIERDEKGTHERLRAARKELFQPEIARHHGRIFKLMGDGLLAEFASVVDAVECAVKLQRGLAERNAAVPDDQCFQVRMGINLGEVIVEGGDRYGNDINIAARLESIAEPGGIVVSGIVRDQVARRLAITFEDMGELKLKNITLPVRVYSVQYEEDHPRLLKPSLRRSLGSIPVRLKRRGLKTLWIAGASLVSVGLVALLVWWPEGGEATVPPPTPAPVHVSIASSSNKGEWLDQAITSFNAASQTNPGLQLDGRPVVVEAVLEQFESGEKEHYRSGAMIADILAGKITPVIATPADDSWILKLNKEWLAVNAKRIATGHALGVARTPLVIAMWDSRARALECWPSPKPGCTWESISRLASSSDGWKMHGRPDWGKFKLGYGYFGESNSGTLTPAILCMRGLGMSGGLTLEDVSANNGCGRMITAVEKAKVHSGKRSAELLDKMRTGGPEYLDAVITNEQEVVEFYKKKPSLREPLVSAYPQDGTVVITHPFAILDGAPWVSPEQIGAAEMFRKYLLSDGQQLLLVTHGLRPLNPQAPLGPPLDSASGVNPTADFPVLEVPEVLVLDRVGEVWHEVKKHAHIAIVFDKSDSMTGPKITYALNGAQEFVSAMDAKDWLAWLAFDSDTYLRSHGLKSATGEQLLNDIRSTTAGGGTALYDAVATAFDLIDSTRKTQGDSLRYGVVILSDGQDTSSTRTTLALLEAKLRPTEHDPTGIQIHTIGIGEDLDEAVLRKIANLGHGKYWKVDNPANVVQVYKDIATYY